jgi:aminomethyltransferase
MTAIQKSLKKTPLTSIHEKLGAHMVDFAGWYMPVRYTTVIEEHNTVRNSAALFDVSHMGEIEIRGAHAFPFLQKLLSTDLLRLHPNQCMYALLCFDHGGTVDDCFVYCFNSSRYWLVVNAANILKDIVWLRDHASKYSVTIRDLSAETAKIDIQGPLAAEIATKFSPFPLSLLERFDAVEMRFKQIPAVISRSGYTGEDGFEIYFENTFAGSIWNALLESDPRCKPAGLGARDTLRIEACYSLYGHELSEHISPVEAGIEWVVHDKKEDFIGKKVLLAQKEQGTKKHLHAFIMEDRAVPRSDYEIIVGGEKSGYVSSGTYSPTLGKSIGMGFIENRKVKSGDTIEIDIRGKKYKAGIVKRPFYKFQGR